MQWAFWMGFSIGYDSMKSFVILTISPASTSLMNVPPTESMAALSDTSMYPPLTFPMHNGLNP